MALFRSGKQHRPQAYQSQPEKAQLTLPAPPASDEYGRRSVNQQRDYLLGLVDPLPAFGMFLLDASGLAVCEDIVSQNSLPERDLCITDGYAVRSALAIPGARVEATQVRAGEPMPPRLDAVIPAGDTEFTDGIVTVVHPVATGDYVRQAGSDVRQGELLITTGSRLDARHAGMLAGAGIDRVLARPLPRVVVLSITDPDASTDAQHSVSEVNSHLIASVAKADDAQVWRVVANLGDDTELRDLISDQLIRADLIIAATRTGADRLLAVAKRMGGVDVAEVAMEPGGQVGFGLIGEDEIPMFFLPIDPMAAYVSYQEFVRPMVRKLMGNPNLVRAGQQMRCDTALTSRYGVTEVRCATCFNRGDASGEPSVTPLGNQTRQSLKDLAKADALIVIDPWVTSVSSGDHVNVWMLSDD